MHADERLALYAHFFFNFKYRADVHTGALQRTFYVFAAAAVVAGAGVRALPTSGAFACAFHAGLLLRSKRFPGTTYEVSVGRRTGLSWLQEYSCARCAEIFTTYLLSIEVYKYIHICIIVCLKWVSHVTSGHNTRNIDIGCTKPTIIIHEQSKSATAREGASPFSNTNSTAFSSSTSSSLLDEPPLGEGWDENGNDLSKVANDVSATTAVGHDVGGCCFSVCLVTGVYTLEICFAHGTQNGAAARRLPVCACTCVWNVCV